jgi:hypothetical protein
VAGHGNVTPGEILEIWWRHNGRLDRDIELMYSMCTPFSEIKPVHPALTSSAIQAVKEQVVRRQKRQFCLRTVSTRLPAIT